MLFVINMMLFVVINTRLIYHVHYIFIVLSIPYACIHLYIGLLLASEVCWSTKIQL
jgi:hypothetical protein